MRRLGSAVRQVAVAATVAVLAGCSVGGGGAEPYAVDGCVRAGLEGRTVARVWDEAILAAIRRDVPAPTVHARNLFHLSAAMWDAWAAYDPVADGYLVREKLGAGDDVRAARETAMSFAAYRLLLHRYSYAGGLEQTFAELTATMRRLCLRIDAVETDGDSPAALGNRIAAAYIAHGRADGALEATRYADEEYAPVNAPLVVGGEDASMRDPSRWQPLALDRLVAQNGVPIPGKVQRFIGSQWGHVRSFALPRGRDGMPVDPGQPPRYGEAAFAAAAVEVLRLGSQLDATDGAMVDIGPGARGANSLGHNDGRGRPVNPLTGRPYAPNLVPRGDFARALTEFWADGPESETPPGHWNTVANAVSDSPEVEHVLDGRRVDRLEWDVKLLFTLNGAVHDAAVAAWGAKRHYDTARPISMIRYLAARRELPLVRGLVEVATRATTAPDGRHAGLRAHVGEVVVRAWRGDPGEEKPAGVGWIPASRWAPYQRKTFVSPAFAGYVSGHSTFSRAAAEVLTAFTGSPYFPGGLFEWKVPAGSLTNEPGPTRDLTLQWATYADAADDAGVSRLFGGIHISADDVAGRRLGYRCGRDALALARRYFAGTAHA